MPIVAAFDEVIELGLMLQEVLAGWLGSLELQSQMHAFMPAVLLRMAGLDALDRDTEPDHHTDSLERLKSEFGLAKGTPLSVRIALGKPNRLNTAQRLERCRLPWWRKVPRRSEDMAAGGVGDR